MNEYHFEKNELNALPILNYLYGYSEDTYH